VRMAVAAWSAVMLLMFEDLSSDTDWQTMTADTIAPRSDNTFAQFVELVAAAYQQTPSSASKSLATDRRTHDRLSRKP
jgi:hypothetical protein